MCGVDSDLFGPPVGGPAAFGVEADSVQEDLLAGELVLLVILLLLDLGEGRRIVVQLELEDEDIGVRLGHGGLIPALVFDWRMPWFFIFLFILLAVCSNMSPVFLSILRETNPADNPGICASLSNFVPFALIALLGNLAGFLMELFDPVITDEGIRVYGANSYIAVFLLYTLFALAGLFLTFGIRETRGQHLDVD